VLTRTKSESKGSVVVHVDRVDLTSHCRGIRATLCMNHWVVDAPVLLIKAVAPSSLLHERFELPTDPRLEDIIRIVLCSLFLVRLSV